jgi:thiamine monophosphate kinase
LADVPLAGQATLEDALGGGEDYELLATLPDGSSFEGACVELAEAFGVALTEIGSIVDGERITAIGVDGVERLLDPTGWDHFR